MTTYRETAESWELWCEYVDPGATWDRNDWENTPIDERVAHMVACFGPECEGCGAPVSECKCHILNWNMAD